jgi:hypothetical protein
MVCYRVFQGWNNSGHVIQSPEEISKYNDAIQGMYDHKRFHVIDQNPTKKYTGKQENR